MKKFLFCCLLFLLPIRFLSAGELPSWAPYILHSTAHWYKVQGEPEKTAAYLRPYLESAWRVSGHIHGYPGDDRIDNCLRLFCVGAQESEFDRNFVEINIPGTRCRGHRRIRFFSLDFGWCGDNQYSLPWTEATVAWLQRGGPIPEITKESTHRQTLIGMRRAFRIPKRLKLKIVDLSHDASIEHRFWWWNHAGRPGKFTAETGFTEDSADTLDALLYYRAIEEYDRRARGWSWGGENKPLYRRLARLVALVN